MTIAHETTPILFVLEDDEELLEEIRLLAEEVGFIILTATSLEEAVALARAQMVRVTLALVDIMVPTSKADFKKLRKLQANRLKLILDRNNVQQSGEGSAINLPDAYADLNAIDAEIQPLIDLRGGFKLIDHLVSEDLLPDCKVVVFTATKEPYTDKEFQDAKTKLAEKNRWCGWRPKPIDPDVLRGLLEQYQNGTLT